MGRAVLSVLTGALVFFATEGATTKGVVPMEEVVEGLFLTKQTNGTPLSYLDSKPPPWTTYDAEEGVTVNIPKIVNTTVVVAVVTGLFLLLVNWAEKELCPPTLRLPRLLSRKKTLDTQVREIGQKTQRAHVEGTSVASKPKRGRSAYAFYMKDTSVRAAIQKEHPDWGFGQVSKALGEQWKAMDMTQRQPYIDQSDAEKAEVQAAQPEVTEEATAGTVVKPKRARSAYAYYMKDTSVREAIKKQHPEGDFGVVSKAIGEQWRAMDETARQPYVEQSEAEKAEIGSATVTVTTGRKPRARSAYNFYMKDSCFREAIQKAHPDWRPAEVFKALGEQWKAMDETARQPYVEEAKADRAKVEAEASVVQSASPSGKKRARSAYAFYASDKSVRETIQKAHPDWKFGELSKALGQQWKALDVTQRQPYVDQSEAEKAAFASVQSVVVGTGSSAPPKAKRGRSAYAFSAGDKPAVDETARQSYVEQWVAEQACDAVNPPVLPFMH